MTLSLQQLRWQHFHCQNLGREQRKTIGLVELEYSFTSDNVWSSNLSHRLSVLFHILTYHLIVSCKILDIAIFLTINTLNDNIMDIKPIFARCMFYPFQDWQQWQHSRRTGLVFCFTLAPVVSLCTRWLTTASITFFNLDLSFDLDVL